MKKMARFGSSAIPASLIRGALRRGGGGVGGGRGSFLRLSICQIASWKTGRESAMTKQPN